MAKTKKTRGLVATTQRQHETSWNQLLVELKKFGEEMKIHSAAKSTGIEAGLRAVLRESREGVLKRALTDEPEPKYVKEKGHWVLCEAYKMAHPRHRPIRREIEAIKKRNRKRLDSFRRHGESAR